MGVAHGSKQSIAYLFLGDLLYNKIMAQLRIKRIL